MSPLNSLTSDQIRRSTEGKVRATILNVTKSKTTEELELDSSGSNSLLLKEAKYDIVFTHPEAVLSCQKGLGLFQSMPYQQSVQAAVVDEAHCILEWGDDFRKDYANLAMLCATFPTVPVVALTATATAMCQHRFLELKQDAIMQGCRPKEMKGGVVEKAFDLKSVHKRNNLYPIIEENEVQT